MKILFITLSNIGDCILTLPVLDFLRQKYPLAKITCLVSARPGEIFINNPAVADVVIFDKQAKLIDKIKLFFTLSRENFDLVVDLRNSFFGAFLPAKKSKGLFWSALRRIPAKIKHMKEKHLFWAKLLDYSKRDKKYQSLNITLKDIDYIQGILNRRQNLAKSTKLIVVAPGSRSRVKCWDKQNFSQLCRQLVKDGYRIVLVGDAFDQPICDYLQQALDEEVLNLCAKTNLSQLAVLLKAAQLLITNDSAVMHLASYLNVPVVAIFGPTDEKKYGPWSENSAVVKKDIFCRPCEKAQCRFGGLECLTAVKPADVLGQVESLLANKGDVSLFNKGNVPFCRILIVRTDRLGDVLLSTPVVRALRQEFSQSYISMLISPYTKDALEGNPDLDEVITFDKDARDISWWVMFKLIQTLRRKKIDLAIILHPTFRMHLLIFLA